MPLGGARETSVLAARPVFVGRHARPHAVIRRRARAPFLLATTRLGAYYYVLSSLGMLTAATAVEAGQAAEEGGRRGDGGGCDGGATSFGSKSL